MTIAVECSFCHDELTEPGALLFSPPLDDEWRVEKKHLCVTCFARVKVDDDPEDER